MPSAWSLNPYRGCTHSCDGMHNDAFTTKIVVRANLPETLRAELSSPSWKRKWVAVSAATGVHQPGAVRYRRAVETLVDFRTPVSVVTMSTLMLRDANLLADRHRAPAPRWTSRREPSTPTTGPG